MVVSTALPSGSVDEDLDGTDGLDAHAVAALDDVVLAGAPHVEDSGCPGVGIDRGR